MAATCPSRRVLVEIPAPQPKSTAHRRRPYLDGLNSSVGAAPSPCRSRNISASSSPQRRLAPDSFLGTDSIDEDTVGMQLSPSQQQLVQVLQSLLLQQKTSDTPKPQSPEGEPRRRRSDVTVLQEDLQQKKSNVYRSIPYSRLGSRRDAHSYRKAYPHLLAFKRSCEEGARLLLQSCQWEAALDYALLAWRYVGALPRWETGSHNLLQEQCYSMLAAQCSTALRHHRPPPDKGLQLQKRFKMAYSHSPQISSCIRELESIMDSPWTGDPGNVLTQGHQ